MIFRAAVVTAVLLSQAGITLADAASIGISQNGSPGTFRSRSGIPLPRRRPPEAPAREAPGATSNEHARSSEVPDAEAAARFAACWSRLHRDLAVLEPELPLSGPGQCGASDLVRLKAIRLGDGHMVRLQPAAKVRCAMADALVHWVRADVAPAVELAGTRLAKLTIDTSYECRTRNNATGGKMSEHATGNAVDLRELTFVDGKSLALTDSSADKELRATLARSACARFQTVLGPGSDSYHENHIHLDVLERRAGYRICQWDVR